MSETVGSIQYELDLDDKKFKSGVKSAKSDMLDLKGALDDAEQGSKIFAASVAAAGVAIAGMAYKALSAFMESETVVAQVNAVIQSTGGAAQRSSAQMQELATSLQSMSGASDEAVMSGEAMLATFTSIKGEAFDNATKATLDLATALNGGLIPDASAMRSTAQTLGKALNDPAEGLTRLTRIGVQFTEAQKKQIEALQKAGDLSGAQAVILKELQVEFGGSAKAAGQTFAGQLNIAKETFGDFMELVGQGIANALRPLVEHFQNWYNSIGGAQGLFERFNATLAKLRDYFPVIASVIALGITPALYGMATATWAAMSPLIPFLAAGLAIGYALKYILDTMGGITGVMTALQPLFAIIGVLWNDTILPALQRIWANVQGLWVALQQLWQLLEPILVPLFKGLAILLGITLYAAIMVLVSALNIVVAVLRAIAGIIPMVIDWFRNLGAWSYDTYVRIKNTWPGIKDAIISPFREAFDWIKNNVNSVINALKNLNPFTKHSPSLVEMVQKGAGVIADTYGNMFNSIVDASKVAMPDVKATTAISTGSTSTKVVSPTINISTGAFLGTPGEARAFAEVIQTQIKNLERQAAV